MIQSRFPAMIFGTSGRWMVGFVLLLTLAIPQVSVAQSANRIASPRPNGWIVDQTETLSDLQKRLINELAEDINRRYQRELMVAVVESTGGTDPRRFATQLFNHWKIGNQHRNQGILIFASVGGGKGNRAAEIVLGDGLKNAKAQQAAQSIMNQVMIPKFKSNDAGGAIYNGVQACAKRILMVGELGVADELPEITAEQAPVTAEAPLPDGDAIASSDRANQSAAMSANGDANAASDRDSLAASSSTGDELAGDSNSFDAGNAAPDSNRDVNNGHSPNPRFAPQRFRRGAQKSYLPLWLGLGGAGLLATFFGSRYYLRYRKRMCETCRLDRVLLTEVQDDEFLEPPEIVEENIGSVDYDVWACLECEDVIKVRHGRWITRYSRCPDCSYVTRFKITQTVIPATTISGGIVRVEENCKNCSYHHTYTYATPRIRKSSSGSGGVFSSGSGRSSSSSSSAGGFSSGGGASGRW